MTESLASWTVLGLQRHESLGVARTGINRGDTRGIGTGAALDIGRGDRGSDGEMRLLVGVGVVRGVATMTQDTIRFDTL